jgi:hypothetical protein
LNYFSYFSEIEETFVRRRGRNLLLSPLDWALIEAWKERGVPLAVVLRGIEAVFDQSETDAKRKKNIKSLMYCRDEIELQYESWLASQIGNQAINQTIASETNESESQKLPADKVLSHLKFAAEKLQANHAGLNHNWNAVSADILKKLRRAYRQFASEADAENLEKTLSEIDRQLDEALLESYSEEKLTSLKKETAAQLRVYKPRMTEEIYAQTFRTLLLKSLREKTEIPRLSLFYI